MGAAKASAQFHGREQVRQNWGRDSISHWGGRECRRYGQYEKFAFVSIMGYLEHSEEV